MHIPPFKILHIIFSYTGIFTHLPYKVTFTVPGMRTWIYLFWLGWAGGGGGSFPGGLAVKNLAANAGDGG